MQTSLKSVAVIVTFALIVSCGAPEEETSPDTPPPPPPPAAQAPADGQVQPLVAWIEAEPEEGPAPLEVKFTAKLKGGTPPITVEWHFGDESQPTAEPNPVHTYAQPGTYTVDLFANDAGGDDDDDDYDIEVR
jgi:PKD repeat protein